MRRAISLLAAVLLIVAVGGQSQRFFAQVVVEPTEPVSIVSPTYIDVPPPQQEVITPSPSPAYVWVPGQWNRTAENWNWVAGQWVQPPFSNVYWVPGYWQHRGGQFVWETGHWAAADQGVVVAKPVTLPPVYVEAKPVAPAASTRLVWQPGYWDWRGTWVWVPGEYIQTQSPTAVWVPGQWVVGADGMWRWSAAHWAVS
jgi:hypothetical protein